LRLPSAGLVRGKEGYSSPSILQQFYISSFDKVSMNYDLEIVKVMIDTRTVVGNLQLSISFLLPCMYLEISATNEL